MTPEQEAILILKALEVYAKHPILWSIALVAYFLGVTYLFVTGW